MRTSFPSAYSPFTWFSKQRRKGGQQVPRALCPTHLSEASVVHRFHQMLLSVGKDREGRGGKEGALASVRPIIPLASRIHAPVCLSLGDVVVDTHLCLAAGQHLRKKQRTSFSDPRSPFKDRSTKGKSLDIGSNPIREMAILEVQDSSQYWKPSIYYFNDDDDFLKKSIDETPPSDAIASDLPIMDSFVIKDKHLDPILEMDSDEEIESSVKNLNLTVNESEDLSDYISEDDYTSSDDESSSEEDVLVEHFKIYSNPFLEFDEEIFSKEINPLYNEVLEDLDPILPGNENDHFNAESNLIESLFNKDTMITSPKIDFLLEEFVGELALINSIPPRIGETNFDPKENIHLIKKLLYDNSSPHPPKGLNSENDFEKENSGSTTIHTYISLIEYESFYDESDSASDIFNDDHAHIISPSEYEYVYVDDESDLGDLTTKVVDDISDNSTRKLYVHVPNVLTTLPILYPVFDTLLPLLSENKDKVFNPGILISKEEKSPPLLSRRGLKVFQLINDSEIPMMIYEGDIPILDVPYLHFYPP
nr:hypothetical protein [Tanacetum cinerariifolium]